MAERVRGIGVAVLSGWCVFGGAACGTPPATSASAVETAGEDGGDADVAASGDAASSSNVDGGASSGARAAEQDEGGLPTDCDRTTDDGVCLPPAAFVKRLCKDDFPSVALALFSAEKPFRHAFVAIPTEAWSAGGGATPEKMPVDEEVLILAFRDKPKPGGGMKVSGTEASYEALRWNGTCVTLGASEVRFDPPPNPLNARIIFQRLEPEIRDALKRTEALRPLYLEHRKACKGVSMGSVSEACERLDGTFSRAVAAHVRETGGVPMPRRLP
ncbi:MAG: hypothetical protein AAF928_14560 [Myxococcota bacterium]